MNLSKPSNQTIYRVRAFDLQWDFADKNPRIVLNGWNVTKIDPFPCYSHDEKLVRSYIDNLPFNIPTTWIVSDYDSVHGTNGFADRRYQDIDNDIYYVFLGGKKTPIHYAITKYLIGHEYGHIVEFYITKKLKIKNREEFLKRYAEVRQIPFSMEYGALNWHTNTGEVFANDFRHQMTGLEIGYWPHTFDRIPFNSKIYHWWQSLHRSETEWKMCDE